MHIEIQGLIRVLTSFICN